MYTSVFIIVVISVLVLPLRAPYFFCFISKSDICFFWIWYFQLVVRFLFTIQFQSVYRVLKYSDLFSQTWLWSFHLHVCSEHEFSSQGAQCSDVWLLEKDEGYKVFSWLIWCFFFFFSHKHRTITMKEYGMHRVMLNSIALPPKKSYL